MRLLNGHLLHPEALLLHVQLLGSHHRTPHHLWLPWLHHARPHPGVHLLLLLLLLLLLIRARTRLLLKLNLPLLHELLLLGKLALTRGTLLLLHLIWLSRLAHHLVGLAGIGLIRLTRHRLLLLLLLLRLLSSLNLVWRLRLLLWWLLLLCLRSFGQLILRHQSLLLKKTLQLAWILGVLRSLHWLLLLLWRLSNLSWLLGTHHALLRRLLLGEVALLTLNLANRNLRQSSLMDLLRAGECHLSSCCRRHLHHLAPGSGSDDRVGRHDHSWPLALLHHDHARPQTLGHLLLRMPDLLHLHPRPHLLHLHWNLALHLDLTLRSRRRWSCRATCCRLLLFL